MSPRPTIDVAQTILLLVQIAAIISVICAIVVLRKSGKRADECMKKTAEQSEKVDELLRKIRAGRTEAKAADTNRNIADRFSNYMVRQRYGNVFRRLLPGGGYSLEVSRGERTLLVAHIGECGQETLVLREAVGGRDAQFGLDEESIKAALRLASQRILELLP